STATAIRPRRRCRWPPATSSSRAGSKRATWSCSPPWGQATRRGRASGAGRIDRLRGQRSAFSNQLPQTARGGGAGLGGGGEPLALGVLTAFAVSDQLSAISFSRQLAAGALLGRHRFDDRTAPAGCGQRRLRLGGGCAQEAFTSGLVSAAAFSRRMKRF